jgi:transcriptional regulator with GAF, ATPase, and Fis domain
VRPLADARNEFERWRIQRALVDASWNQSLAAQQLGLSRAGCSEDAQARPGERRGGRS